MTIRLVGAELLHADGRTDMTKLIVAFRNILNALKMNKQKLELVSFHNYFCKTKNISGSWKVNVFLAYNMSGAAESSMAQFWHYLFRAI